MNNLPCGATHALEQHYRQQESAPYREACYKDDPDFHNRSSILDQDEYWQRRRGFFKLVNSRISDYARARAVKMRWIQMNKRNPI